MGREIPKDAYPIVKVSSLILLLASLAVMGCVGPGASETSQNPQNQTAAPFTPTITVSTPATTGLPKAVTATPQATAKATALPAGTPSAGPSPAAPNHSVQVVNETANEREAIQRALGLADKSVLGRLDRIVVEDNITLIACGEEKFILECGQRNPGDASSYYCAKVAHPAIGCADFGNGEIRVMDDKYYASQFASSATMQNQTSSQGGGYDISNPCSTFANTLFHELGHFHGYYEHNDTSEEFADAYANRYARVICGSEESGGYSQVNGSDVQVCLVPMLRMNQYVRYSGIPFLEWDDYLYARGQYVKCLLGEK